MAKGKKGGGKKGGKKGGGGGGGGGKEGEEGAAVISEVEKELFQIQIADLTRRVERLKARCLELEMNNEELQKNYATLDEDRADVIAYLKRVTQQKTEEIEELEERIDALIKSRDAEVEMYQEKITKMDHDFKIMHEHLTSDIKLLTGKLNALEDFRLQKDDLMKKFKQQEIDMQENEERHKRTLYEIERKFVIGKDKLVKEMESRLVKLSADFRDATEIRIAATTHHAIRENIAISNELDLMLEMQSKLSEENRRMKEQDKKLRLQVELHQEERDITLARNRHQIKLLDKLAREHDLMRNRVAQLEYASKRVNDLEIQLEHVKQQLENSLHYCRVVDQKLHAALYEQNELQLRMAESHLKYDRLVIVIETAARAINDALKITDAPDVDEAVIKDTQDNLMVRLLELMDTTTMEYMPLGEPSVDSIIPYQKGDLGIIPKSSLTLVPVTSKSLAGIKASPSSRSRVRMDEEDDMERASSTRMSSEDAMERTSSVRIAEVMEQPSSVRIAEDVMEQPSSARLAEGAIERKSSIKIAEGAVERKSSMKITEGAIERKSSIKIAEGAIERKSSVKIAEGAMERRSSVKIAEGTIERKPSVKISEDALQRKSSVKISEDVIERKSSIKIAEDAVGRKSSAKITDDAVKRKSSLKVVEGTEDVDHPPEAVGEEEAHKDEEPSADEQQ